MSKFIAAYNGFFSTYEEIIEADSLEDATKIAGLKSVYTNFIVKKFDEDEEEEEGKK